MNNIYQPPCSDIIGDSSKGSGIRYGLLALIVFAGFPLFQLIAWVFVPIKTRTDLIRSQCKWNDKLKKIIAPILACIVLAGCNQNNSSDGYSLKQLQSVDEGEVFSLELTGVDANARNYSGSVRVVNDPHEVQNGVMGTLKRFYLNITDEDLPTIFPLYQDSTLHLISTYALDENGLLHNVLENSGRFCTNTSPDKLPDYVKPGDAGSLSPLQCDGGTTDYRDWEVVSEEEGLVVLIMTTTSKDLNGSIVSTEVKRFILDKVGNIVGFQIETDFGTPTYQSRINLYSQ